MSPARRTSLTSITRSVSGFAQQKSASPLLLFVLGERRCLVRRRSRRDLRGSSLAGAAGAVAAAIRQHQIGGHRRSEHGVAIRASERMIARRYGNLVWHRQIGFESSCARATRVEREASVIRVLLIGCGDVALRTADLLHPKVRLYGLTRRADDIPRLRAHGIVPIVGDLDRLCEPRPAARGAVRGAAFRAAAVGRSRRSAHANADRRADAGAKHTTAIRLHFDVGRLRRLRRRARRRSAAAARADAALRGVVSPPRIACASGRCAHGVALVDPARARHLRRDATAARTDQAGHAGALAG